MNTKLFLAFLHFPLFVFSEFSYRHVPVQFSVDCSELAIKSSGLFWLCIHVPNTRTENRKKSNNRNAAQRENHHNNRIIEYSNGKMMTVTCTGCVYMWYFSYIQKPCARSEKELKQKRKENTSLFSFEVSSWRCVCVCVCVSVNTVNGPFAVGMAVWL